MIINSLGEPDDHGRQVGWTEDIGIRPAFRDGRLLRALLSESLKALRDAGASSAGLGVDLLNPGPDEGNFTSLGYRVASLTPEYMLGPYEPGSRRA